MYLIYAICFNWKTMYPSRVKTDEHILLNHYNMSDSQCKLLSAFIDLNSSPITSTRKKHFVIVTNVL